MAALSEIFQKVRLRLREKDTQFFTDEDLISLANDAVKDFTNILQEHECKLLYAEASIAVTEGVSDYVVSDKALVVPGFVYLDETELPVYSEYYPDTLSYNETDDGVTLHNHTDGTLFVGYWTEPDAFTSSEDQVPFGGLWDAALVRTLTVECKEIRRHRVANVAALAASAVNAATSKSIEKYGTIPRSIQSSLNVIY